jgi:hypothetical protein
METKLTLYIVARNKSTFDYDILSTQKDDIICPSSLIIPNTNISTQLYNLLKQYVDINDDIVNYIFLDIKINTIINIVYFCCVPIDLPIKNAQFLPINQNKVHVTNLQKIITII